MNIFSRERSQRMRRILAATAVTWTILGSSSLAAQATWTVDPKTSMAWWQIQPHIGHLWATTCPEDQSWQPGESRGSDYVRDKSRKKEVKIVSEDETRIPVYPRDTVYAVCSEAVSGTVAVANPQRWSGVKGLISVNTRMLVNGMDMRDEFARRSVYGSDEYPDVRFQIDSLANVQPGDTLRADAVGFFTFRGVRTEMLVPIEAWQEKAGFRVKGKFFFPASHLVSVYKVSRFSLGLGIGTDIWKTVYMGFDVILVPQGASRASR